MDAHLAQLRESSNRLHALVAPLDDATLERPAYPSEWSIADVLSHIGSGAVIMRRRLQDAIAREATPDDFAPEVWDAWNAKSPRDKADDALVADRQLVDDLEALTDEDKDGLEFALGPLTLSPTEFVARAERAAAHVGRRGRTLRDRAGRSGALWLTISDDRRFTGNQLERIASSSSRRIPPEHSVSAHYDAVDFTERHRRRA